MNRLKPVLSRRAGLALALHGEMGIGKTHAAKSLLAAVTCRTYRVHATAPLSELVRLLPRPARLPRWAEGSLQAPARGEHSEIGSIAEALAYQGRAPEMAEVLARLPQLVRERPAWLERYLRLLFISGAYAEVLDVWQSHPAFHQQASPSAIYRVAYALMDRGDLTAARALAEARLAQGGTDPYFRAELLDICASVAHYQGAYEYEQADGLFTEVLTLFREHPGGWDAVANTRRNRVLNRLQLGQYRESLPDLAEALKHYAERGKGVFYAQTLTMISDVHLELGEYEQAEEVLCEALEVFERITPQPFLITCLANLVSLYADWQPPYGRLLASRYGERCLK